MIGIGIKRALPVARFALALGLLALGSGSVKAASIVPRCFLVMAGVTDYAPDSTILPLRFAARDAGDLALALRAGARKWFGPSNVRVFLLTGHRVTAGANSRLNDIPELAATKTNFVNTFATICREARSDDVVLVYFAGHGVPLGPDEYGFLTQDAATPDLVNSPFRTDWTVTGSELRGWLRSLAARKGVVILDTCAAGAFADRGDAGGSLTHGDPGPSQQEISIGNGTVFPILMGCAADAASHESPRFGHGLLTYALLEGLRGGGLNGDRLDVKSWLAQAVIRVGQLAAEVQSSQQPVLVWPGNARESFVLAQFDEETLAGLPALGRVTSLVEPRFSSRDDPGGPFERDTERLVLGSLRKAEAEGSIQLLPRGQATDDAIEANGLLSNKNGAFRADIVIRHGRQRTKLTVDGDIDPQKFAAHVAAELLEQVETSR